MCVIWGVPYLMIRVAVRELSPSLLVLLRTGIAAALLVPFAARRGELAPMLRHWRPLLLFSAVEIALPWLLLARAEQEITSSLAGLLIAAVPLVGAATVAATGGEDGLGGRRLVGLLVGMVGVAAIVGLDVGHVTFVPLLEIAVVAVCYAVGPIPSRSDARRRARSRRRRGLARAGGDPVRAGGVSVRSGLDARGAGDRVGRRSRRPLYGGRVHRLLRADRGGRAGPGDRDHIR